MTKPRFLVLTLLSLVAALMLTSPAEAADEDPPGRVARLNFTHGSVSFQPGGEGDWLTAVRNRPLTTGDNLWTGRGSRAELHVGSTALRMGAETSLSFLDLDDRATQLRLAQGSLLLRVRHIDDEDAFEVDTPNLAFTILRPGEYRIDVNGNGDETIITDWHGQGEVTGDGYSYQVLAGQRARFYGFDQLRHDIDPLPGNDDFDDWAFDRDRREDRLETQNYISSEITGYEDLDDYGHWRYVADYGNVWFPSEVVEGWAPYRFGHWAWIYPWGWTWVEDEPWGFAPFHYGRWAYVPGGWCWVPGPVVVRPVYAPALVAFVGGGVLAVGGGPGVAWFPLGPREVWVPPYRASRTYVNNVNITNTNVNVTHVTNVYNTYITNNTTNIARINYVNQHVTNAVTAVSHDTFVNARPVAKNVVQVNPKQVAEAPVTHAAPVQPVRPSVLGSGSPAQAKPPASVIGRQVVAKRAPAPVPAPFEQRLAAHNQTPNLRVEGQAPSAPEARNTPRPPAANRGGEERAARPGAGNPNLPQARNVPRPPESNRTPQAAPRSGEAERPEGGNHNVRPEPREAPRPSQPERQVERNPAPRPPHATEEPQQSWSHQLAKPAPPAQPHNEQHAQQEEQKFRNWEQQRQASPQPSPHK